MGRVERIYIIGLFTIAGFSPFSNNNDAMYRWELTPPLAPDYLRSLVVQYVAAAAAATTTAFHGDGRGATTTINSSSPLRAPSSTL